MVVSSADIAKAEQEAVEEVLPNSTHAERLFRTRRLLITLRPLSNFLTYPRLLISFLLTPLLYPSEHHERNQQPSFMTAATIVSMMRFTTHGCESEPDVFRFKGFG